MNRNESTSAGTGASARPRLGRDFDRLWAAFAVSTAGTWLAIDAFQLVAVLALHSGAARVSLLAAAGLAAGALIAVPLGPWVEFRRKRPVMIGADLARCAALLTLPVAYVLGSLTFTQLLAVSVVVAAADILFRAASGSHLKTLVAAEDLLAANARFETTTWTATALGPPLGGLAISAFGPLTTVAADAVSYLLSALGIRSIRAPEPRPEPRRRGDGGVRVADILEGWRYIWHRPGLRALFLNTTLVNSLITATTPLLTVLLMGDLGFPPWQFALVFSLPCLGGLLGARLARPLTARYGERRVLLTSGVARACWLPWLAFTGPGWAGFTVVALVEFGLITCCAVFGPVYATRRLKTIEPDRVTRVLSAWTVTGNAGKALLTLAFGGLAALTGTRAALGAAGLALLATPLLLSPDRLTRTGRRREGGAASAVRIRTRIRTPRRQGEPR
ncbi:MFS transporter [Streptomyces beihaiensis]|uniref:MFS transporter n=1 Tax=Streptomyces beihaiensis TaxID=2984495 RepID=A0ABT3TZ41_9ACTN|nr:MFS transporter [Streptomyces beihaiensis]MCX3062315.1 MFS transporter [Streptomyces beihaiensis]